ncbi:MAG: glutaminase A [bacterium]|nr:glutaminase A [bacterium]
MTTMRRPLLAALLLLASAAGGAAQVPAKADVERALAAARARYAGLTEGRNADYIPALATVPSTLFGIVVVTVDGQITAVGDVERRFSIQSISKVFTLAEVMQQRGDEAIANGVGVDATGQAFNSITAIEQYKGREMNPLVNAGAIAVTSMVEGESADEVWATILAGYGAFAGRTLAIDAEVYASEAATNQRNQAIGMLMHAYGLIAKNPAQATDLYTRQCSVAVDTRDLATMAATLANGGVNPVTKATVIDARHVPGVLAVMATAGLYDDSGKWLFRTGLPAKSGVGGGIIAVSPGKFGIAAFSPPLDAAGNSVRAQRAIMDVSNALGGNPYAVTPR